MAFDVSRFTFDAWNDYFGVVMEQGRVQTDADWNEWLAEFARRVDAGTLDLLGRAAVPATTPDAFRITIPSGGGSISIGCGRMYVDGVLVENHGPYADGAYDMTGAVWDPALEELSGAPQPPPAAGRSVDFAKQRYFAGASLAGLADGQYLAYLDVWRRPVVYLQDDGLIDKAVLQLHVAPCGTGISLTCHTVCMRPLVSTPIGLAACRSPALRKTSSSSKTRSRVATEMGLRSAACAFSTPMASTLAF